MKLDIREISAVLAGLRCLQNAIDAGVVCANDGDIGCILTCDGEVVPLTEQEINQLCERLNQE